MQFINGVTARVTAPDGGTSAVTPTFMVAPSAPRDCREAELINAAFIKVDFTPDAPGTWRADIEVTPKEVGAFSRPIQVDP